MESRDSTPLEVCEQGDVKGLSKDVRQGDAHEMTGVEEPYEAPERHELRMDTVGPTAEEVARSVLAELDRLGWPVRP